MARSCRQPMREPLVSFTVSIPKPLHARLKTLAADEDRSLNDLVTLALRLHIMVKEDMRAMAKRRPKR
jgi:predicted HicB family RNase H-like nuclease